jgi:DNA processing protein
MENIKHWIALEQVSGIGPAHMIEIKKGLSEINCSLSDISELTYEEIKAEFNYSEKSIEAVTKIPELLEKIEPVYFDLIDREVQIIPFFSESYPDLLKKNLGNSIPPILYCLGEISILKNKGIAILGDKDISDRGELIAFEAAHELSKHGIATVSGFAKGAGIMAHRGALVNGGTTIAVVPYGIMHFSIPDLLKDVYDPSRIIVISPFFPSLEASVYQAFSRNRDICAMSEAVYIIEAPTEGGIFEAAKSAHKMQVPLFTTKYSQYPKSAEGNQRIIDEYSGKPVFGKMVNDLLVPNMDTIIGMTKFGR